MVNSSEQYDWSSYRFNALGEVKSLLNPHPLYRCLDEADDKRQSVYRSLFNRTLDATQLDEVRAATQSGTPLGDDSFRTEIESVLLVRVGQIRRGRPVR
jgi:putative transposase